MLLVTPGCGSAKRPHHEARAAVAEGRRAVGHLQGRGAVERLHEVAARDVGVLHQALVVPAVLRSQKQQLWKLYLWNISPHEAEYQRNLYCVQP